MATDRRTYALNIKCSDSLMLIPILILGAIGCCLILGGGWIVFFSRTVRSTSDLSRVALLGFLGAALTRIFWKPREQYHKGWNKNVFGLFFIMTGFIILCAVWLFIKGKP